MYRTLRNFITRKTISAKKIKNNLEKNCEEIDILMGRGKREEAYKTVRKLSGVHPNVEQKKIEKERLFMNRNSYRQKKEIYRRIYIYIYISLYNEEELVLLD